MPANSPNFVTLTGFDCQSSEPTCISQYFGVGYEPDSANSISLVERGGIKVRGLSSSWFSNSPTIGDSRRTLPMYGVASCAIECKKIYAPKLLQMTLASADQKCSCRSVATVSICSWNDRFRNSPESCLPVMSKPRSRIALPRPVWSVPVRYS